MQKTIDDILKDFDDMQHLMDLDEQDKQTIKAFIRSAIESAFEATRVKGSKVKNSIGDHDEAYNLGIDITLDEVTRQQEIFLGGKNG